MRTWMLVGSLVAGVLVFVYEWYSTREHQEGPHGHGGGGGAGGGGGPSMSEEDFIEINTTSPKDIERTLGRDVKLPGPDEVCSICLEPMTSTRTREVRKFCIISLPQCGHWFHQRCAYRLLEYHPQCPICRVDIDGATLRARPVRVLSSSGELDSDQENQ